MNKCEIELMLKELRDEIATLEQKLVVRKSFEEMLKAELKELEKYE